MLINMTGVDGSGKGTQLQYLADYFEQRGKKVFMSKAYGPCEKELFSLFMERSHDLAVMFMFQALHVQQRIRAEKALQDGAIVLADRWDDAYLAYHSQNGILAEDPELREKLNLLAFGGINPDLTFMLKVPVEISMENCLLRGADFFDRKGVEYHQSLSDGLEQLAERYGWVVLDGNRAKKTIHEEIVSVVEKIVK